MLIIKSDFSFCANVLLLTTSSDRNKTVQKCLSSCIFYEYINFITYSSSDEDLKPVFHLKCKTYYCLHVYVYIFIYTYAHIPIYICFSMQIEYKPWHFLHFIFFLLMSWAVCYTGNMPWFIHSNTFHLQLGLNFPSFEEEFHAVNNVHSD